MDVRQELLVKTKNPAALDITVQKFGGVVGQDIDGNYEQVQTGVYAIRSVAMNDNITFIEYMVLMQGYGEVIGKRPIT